MKHWLAYICILIFSLQVVPVKEIGKLLFNGQVTEEEVQDCGHSGDDAFKVKKEIDPLHSKEHTQEFASMVLFSQKVSTAIEIAERLPQNFTGDIFCPPPDIS